MTAQAESTLIRLLSDTESLNYLTINRMEPEVIPTEPFREVIDWSLRYLGESGRAPTVLALEDRFTKDFFGDREIDLADLPEETIEWAVTKLRSTYVFKNSAVFSRELATAVADAPDEDRVDILAEKAAELAAIVQLVTPRRSRVDLRQGAEQLWEGYLKTQASGGAPEGMLFGLPEVDDYTHGIHETELALVPAPPKTGKSWFLDFIASKEHERGRIGALFTLENSIEMTQMRLGCIALGLSIEELMTGTLDKDDQEKLRHWVFDVLAKSDVPLHIFNPPPSMRTPQAIVQQANAVGAESLMIDQLTFMEAVKGRSRERQDEEIGRMMHDLKSLISTGRHPMACALAHQINRDGTKRASSTGRLDMNDLAGSSETERTADWVFGLNATPDQVVTNRMELQTLACRRVKPKHFELFWHIDVGRILVKREIPESEWRS